MLAVRRMEPKDCEAVFEIAKHMLPEHWSLEEIRKVLHYNYNIYYVAYYMESKKIIGFAGIMVIAEDAELLNIAVEYDAQRQGAGSLLLDKMLEQAWNSQADRMLLEVRSSNKNSQTLYYKKGFQVIGTRENYYSHPTEDALIMSCVKSSV